MKCAASLSTSSSGVAVRCLLFRQRIQASVARTVVIQRREPPVASKFRCQVCGYTANADVNGARNILAAGHAVSCLWRVVQSGPLVEAGTHRNDSGDSLNVTGATSFRGVEDVNIGFCQRLNSTPRNKRLRQLIPRTQNQSRPASIHLPLPNATTTASRFPRSLCSA